MKVDLQESIRSILSIHVDNKAEVPRILRMVMLAIREEGAINESRYEAGEAYSRAKESGNR